MFSFVFIQYCIKTKENIYSWISLIKCSITLLLIFRFLPFESVVFIEENKVVSSSLLFPKHVVKNNFILGYSLYIASAVFSLTEGNWQSCNYHIFVLLRFTFTTTSDTSCTDDCKYSSGFSLKR